MWIPCICVSISFLLLTMFLAEILRKLIQSFAPQGGIFKIAALEFVAAAEMCGCAFELVIIADNYGVSMYALFLFVLTIWWAQQWGEASACPYIHLEECLKGSLGVKEAVIRTLAEVLGGLLVFRYVQFMWSLEFSETHVGRPHSAAFDKCSADLQVSMLNGALIEGVATLLCRLTSKFLSEKEPEYSTAIDSFVGTSLVVAAFDYSGGYYNPVLATALKFGCRGNTTMEHFVVYWIGSSAGAVASVYLYPMLKGKAKEKNA